MVQDTTDYVEQGLKFLGDPEIYTELETDPSMEIATTANELLDKYNRSGRISGYTSKAHKTDLTNLREQRMYFLRKVHKTPHKLRPIVSCCSGPTQGVSKLTNTILSGYLDSVPSLVKNSTHVITALEQLKVPSKQYEQLTLATMDVVSLYPSIPQTLGINMALQQAIPTNPQNSQQNTMKNMLKELLTLVIKNNTFGFAGKHFKQLKGVAMGTPVAPTLANLFMAKVETDAISSWEGIQPLASLHRRHLDHHGEHPGRTSLVRVTLQQQDGKYKIHSRSLLNLHRFLGPDHFQRTEISSHRHTRHQTLCKGHRPSLLPPPPQTSTRQLSEEVNDLKLMVSQLVRQVQGHTLPQQPLAGCIPAQQPPSLPVHGMLVQPGQLPSLSGAGLQPLFFQTGDRPSTRHPPMNNFLS